MPEYDYECTGCDHRWTVEQRISDPPKRRCPRCKKLKAKRLIASGTSFSLKGPRWFRDGYHG